MTTASSHFIIVTYPLQSHLNPALQFAKRLLHIGARVTIAAAASGYRRMFKDSIPEGITIAVISDGCDVGHDPTDGSDAAINDYIAKLKLHGARTLGELIGKSANEGRPVTCVVYSILLSWAADVARKFNVPSALLWIQSATMLNIYYHYFYGYANVIKECEKDPSWSLDLPGLNLQLKARDLPSFVMPSSPYTFALPAFREQFEELEKESNPKIFVNTYNELEPEALRSIEKFSPVAVGPLLPSSLLDGTDPSGDSLDIAFFRRSEDYIPWLNSRSESSVIYVSFGSISVLSRRQTGEIARALLDTSRPFLWVIREKAGGEEESEEDSLTCMDELEKRGLIVPWCCQVEVLSHPAVGCFVTHCGWNSSLESLSCGVPVVACPQWSDQLTNARMIEDVWKTGVRVRKDEEGVVESGEMKRCFEIVMESEEMRKNAKKWRELAVEASEDNLKILRDFVQEVGDDSVGKESP
ncbi:hypothetical protein Nepgr_009892 [Nepenthes gracilis]|uniref:Glycosyltransferase n=1 Tax=Nepenthes gracilis TaxID=150966 RepID=A0AAD3XKK1_NEPGR|nr:hypothetical protein Nepgr_009892 [Nepenthes gracilis]